ncbi:aldehyde reductase [Diaporthe helianthi]|uniref:Aldehyde reductase n=1 Tax=Diaporthe helianthi TaxID=158607 RepID=A0A2P5HFD9_DIAHE|nr:aldehyde reductase [Diaporthe helianthi]
MASQTKLLREPVLAPSSTLILVTGASGHIGANIVREALNLGYRVRGTARTSSKCKTTVAEQHNHPNYSTAVVSDYSHPSDEIDAAVKGVDSIIHVASDTTFNDDADNVIGTVVAGTEHFLRAAAREPSVKRFTLTSSSTAAMLPKPGVEGIVLTADTWNDEAVEAAKIKGTTVGPNVYPYVVYAASKTQSERALWSFVEKEKPSFVVNAILPDTNFGRVLGSAGATGGLAIGLFKEGVLPWPLSPQYFIDVVDDARLHLCAAVLDQSLKNERIFAYAYPFNISDCMETIKKVRPDVGASKLKPDPNEVRDLSKVPNELGAKLLKEWYGQDGYKTLEQSLKENLEGI